MNKIITNSRYFLKQLEVIDKFQFVSVQMFASKKDTRLEFDIIKMDCECQNDFELPLYKKSITKLIKHLRLIEEQPITLQFTDSELFNVKICEMIV